MASFQHWKIHPAPSGNAQPGSFWLFAILDFADYAGKVATNDTFNILKIKAGWIIRESFYRIARGSDVGADWEIGIGGGTEIKDVSTTTTASTAWVHGSYTSAAPYLNSADKYITVQTTDAAETKGKLEVLLEIVAAPNNAEPVDSAEI